MKILFLALSGLTFDVSTPERKPLGGTESSFCYLARELARTHDVTITTKGEECELFHVKHVNGYRLADYDVVISNAPIYMGGEQKPYYIFWNHLAHFDAAIKAMVYPSVMDSIDCIVYVSEWQRRECEKHFGKAKKTVVIGNGFAPCFENMFANEAELLAAKDPSRAVYTSTPYRGLRLIPDVMDRINQDRIEAEKIRLEVYSGMAVYQGDDAPYEGIYNSLRRDDIAHGGNVSQMELAKRMKAASYMIYPCIFPETFCIAVLEAMAAGCRIVTTDAGALPETLHNFGNIVQERDADNIIYDMVNTFDFNLFESDRTIWLQVQYVNKECTWAKRAQSWNELLTQCAMSSS